MSALDSLIETYEMRTGNTTKVALEELATLRKDLEDSLAQLILDECEIQTRRAQLSEARELITDMRDLARTGLPPDEYNMDERTWNIHKLNRIAGKLNSWLEKNEVKE